MTNENIDLEKAFLICNVNGNISVDDIRKAVVSQSTCTAFDKPLTTYYVFFPKTETSIQIPLGQCGIYLPLEPAKYGIRDMVESRGITMDELLEEVGAGVNNAMGYDFETMEETLTAEIEKLSKSHDTTLVFNKETGYWVVINSKSPVKVYNLVPKEKLVEIGRPYVVV